MPHSLAGRAESQLQARLLTKLRDEGPLSKAQLADALKVSRTTVGAEVARLGELGLAVEAGGVRVELGPAVRSSGGHESLKSGEQSGESP